MAYGNAHWALVVMRRTLDFAVNLDQIPANPFRRKYEMPRKSSEHQKNVYTLRQAEAMLDRVEGLPYEAAYILAAFGGCRTGESLAVRVEDVREIEAGGARFAVASITKQAGNMNGKVVGRTKNAQSAREAIIPEPYCDALLRVRDQRAADGLKWLCMMGASQMGKPQPGRCGESSVEHRSRTCATRGAPSRSSNGASDTTPSNCSWGTSFPA